jgi:hypothetical protein
VLRVVLLQQFQLRRPLYDDGVVRNRSELIRIDLIAHGKHQLKIFMLGQAGNNGAEDIQPTVQSLKTEVRLRSRLSGDRELLN